MLSWSPSGMSRKPRCAPAWISTLRISWSSTLSSCVSVAIAWAAPIIASTSRWSHATLEERLEPSETEALDRDD